MGNVVQPNSTPIYVGSKVVGKVQGDIFYKFIRRNHFPRCPPAIAFDIDTLKHAEQAGAVKVQVTDKDTGTVGVGAAPCTISAGLAARRAKGLVDLGVFGLVTGSQHQRRTFPQSRAVVDHRKMARRQADLPGQRPEPQGLNALG